MNDSRNTNGLVAGLIPANTPCPFLNKCKFKVHTCPGADGRTKPNNFSCAAARAFSMAAEAEKEHPGSGAILRKVVEKDFPLFEIKKREAKLSFSSLPATKEDEDKKA